MIKDPLINATIHKHFSIIKLLLEKYNVNIDASGKIKFMGSVVDEGTVLWFSIKCSQQSKCEKKTYF